MAELRVLIVDDNPLNIELVGFVLEASGFLVEACHDSAQALGHAARFGPDIVLMDIQMPGIDGLALTRLFKADPVLRGIAIIAFTAYAMKGDEQRMRAAGCDGYLSKPIDVANFAAQVRACLPAAGHDNLA